MRVSDTGAPSGRWSSPAANIPAQSPVGSAHHVLAEGLQALEVVDVGS